MQNLRAKLLHSSAAKFLAILFLFATSCEHLDNRTRVRKAKGQVPKEDVIVPPIQEGASENSNAVIEPVDDAPVVEVSKIPRLGIILGPGGLKTFAHIGVLKELEKAKIPVEAIVGIEWGSLIGAFFGSSGSANETEWKLLKLKEDQIFDHSFFKSGNIPGSVNRLKKFLVTDLGNKRHSDFKIPFSCPTYSMNLQHVYWMDRGPILQSLRHCLPYPPIFKPTGDRVAAVDAVKGAVDLLRQQGIELVLFVDVLGEGRLMRKQELIKSYQTGLLWINLQNYMHEVGKYVDEVITVDTQNYGITEYSYRQVLVGAGASQGKKDAQRLLDKYGF